jgi:hypothetical protein
MAMMIRCEQCGRTEDVHTADRNRPHWPWYRVHDPCVGDGRDFDLCSKACLIGWAGGHGQYDERHRTYDGE